MARFKLNNINKTDMKEMKKIYIFECGIILRNITAEFS